MSKVDGYVVDDYRIKSTYNWLNADAVGPNPYAPTGGNTGFTLPTNNETQSSANVSLDKLYKAMTAAGQFTGSLKEFLAKHQDQIDKKEGVFGVLGKAQNAKDWVKNFFNKGQPIAPTVVIEEKRIVKFMPDWAFYTTVTVAALGVGFGIYKLYKHNQGK